MLPKSRFLFKKTVFLKVGAFLVIIPTIIFLTFTQSKPVADAQIAFLYPTSCLGGWRNVDNVTGAPEVSPGSKAKYSEENSALLYNKQTQIYCGGFSGSLPDSANRTKVTLRFSWGIEDGQGVPSVPREEVDERVDVVPLGEDGGASLATSSPLESSSSVSPTEEIQPEDIEPILEPASETESEIISWWPQFISYAFAEEGDVINPVSDASDQVVEVPDDESVVVSQEQLATTSEEDFVKPGPTDEVVVTATTTTTGSTTTATSTTAKNERIRALLGEQVGAEDALFEVLFTMDNESWFTLGYVPRINNDIQFELPLELFTTVEDFSKLQISLKTIERFDDMPTIYLDSMWIEVAYLDAGEDPLSPPGTRPGDIIMSEYSTPETSLVTVFRGIQIDTVSNILSATTTVTASSTIASSSSPHASSTETEALVSFASSSPATASSSTSTPLVIYESDISEIVRKALRATPGVMVEIWFHNRLTDAWVRVADDSLTATVPKARLFDNKVFWLGKDTASLWMFDVASKAYTSQALYPDDPAAIDFITSANQPASVYIDAETLTLEYAPTSSRSITP